VRVEREHARCGWEWASGPRGFRGGGDWERLGFYWALLCCATGCWAAFAYGMLTRFSVNRTKNWPILVPENQKPNGNRFSRFRFFRFGSRFSVFVSRAK
jgi:hypothetical protein